jgi:hypothetical protein
VTDDPPYIDELRYAWIKVRGDASTAEEFHEHAAALIRRAAELDQDELHELAQIMSKPFRRPRGRGVDRERDLWVWATCFTMFNEKRRIPTRAEALEMIRQKYGASDNLGDEAIRKIYDKGKKGPPPL